MPPWSSKSCLSRTTREGLAGGLSAGQLGLLIFDDSWLATSLVEHIRSWLHWAPISTRLAGILAYIEGTQWFTTGQRVWATRLLRMRWPHPLSDAFRGQAAEEHEHRAMFQIRHLHYLPPRVAAEMDPQLLVELHHDTPPRIGWYILADTILTADAILLHLPPDLASQTPLAFCKKWATQQMQVRLTPSRTL